MAELETIAGTFYHGQESAEPAKWRAKPGLAWTVAGAMALIALLAAAFLYISKPQQDGSSPAYRFEIDGPPVPSFFAAGISPDGSHLASFTGVTSNTLWIRRLDELEPRFLPHQTEPTMANLYVKDAGGATPERLLLKTERAKVPLDWSGDGRMILYAESSDKGDADLWILPMSGEMKPIEYLRTPFREWQGQFSPDGRWIAYMSDESGRAEVYVQPFPATGSKWQVSTEGGIQPRWRRDGKELFYLSPVADDQFTAVDLQIGLRDSVFRAALPRKLFVRNVIATSVPGGQARQRNSYDVTRDGQRFILNRVAPTDEEITRAKITVVLNWAAALKK